jgi:hypothetical protein
MRLVLLLYILDRMEQVEEMMGRTELAWLSSCANNRAVRKKVTTRGVEHYGLSIRERKKMAQLMFDFWGGCSASVPEPGVLFDWREDVGV